MHTKKLFCFIIMLLVSVTISAQTNHTRRGSGTTYTKPRTTTTTKRNNTSKFSNRQRNYDDASKSGVEKNDYKMSQRKKQDNSQIVYEVVEQQPSFPGGQTALVEWITKNMRYPSKAKAEGIQGRVLLSFIVEPDGSLSNIQVARSVDPSLDEEAVRIAKAMPKWEPGMQNGMAVRVKYNLPLSFYMR